MNGVFLGDITSFEELCQSYGERNIPYLKDTSAIANIVAVVRGPLDTPLARYCCIKLHNGTFVTITYGGLCSVITNYESFINQVLADVNYNNEPLLQELIKVAQSYDYTLLRVKEYSELDI